MSKTRWKRSPPKNSFISSIPEWLFNSNKTLNSSSRSWENHTSFGIFFKNILKLLKWILKLKGQWLNENLQQGKKVFENFCTIRIVLPKWLCCCVRKMFPTRYKIQIYKINTKLTRGNWNFDVIKELKRNFSGSMKWPVLLNAQFVQLW